MSVEALNHILQPTVQSDKKLHFFIVKTDFALFYFALRLAGLEQNIILTASTLTVKLHTLQQMRKDLKRATHEIHMTHDIFYNRQVFLMWGVQNVHI